MKFCVIGLGSIGQKHFKNLKDLGLSVTAVSRSQKGENIYSSLEECFSIEKFDVVWVCNETSKHLPTLLDLKKLGFTGSVLCEKPLFHENVIFESNFQDLFVTYQLRLHPLVKKLKDKLVGKKILTGLFYVGQYLPDWRPSQDYAQSYSGKVSGGGGVLRDLSHEIDLSLFLIGKMKGLSCIKRKVSDLKIETEDICLIQGESEAVIFQLQMNYLDRKARRFALINTLDSTYELDFIKGSLKEDGEIIEEVKTSFNPYPSIVYNLSSSTPELCSLEEALYIQRVIESCDQSNQRDQWITI